MQNCFDESKDLSIKIERVISLFTGRSREDCSSYYIMKQFTGIRHNTSPKCFNSFHILGVIVLSLL